MSRRLKSNHLVPVLLSCLLLFSSPACTAKTDSSPSAAMYYDRMAYEWRSVWSDPAQMETIHAHHRFVTSPAADVYELTFPVGELPAQVTQLNRTDALLVDSSATYSVEIVGADHASVDYRVANHGREPLPAPAMILLAVLLDGQWCVVWSGQQNHDDNRAPQGLSEPVVAPGATAEGRFTLYESSYARLLPGHYRLSLSSDPAAGWVMAEFDIAEAADALAVEAQPGQQLRRQPAERALDSYIQSLLEQVEHPDSYQLVYASDEMWYLLQWTQTDGEAPALPQGTAYPLSYDKDVVVHQSYDAFTLTVEPETGAATKLRYSFPNHSDATLKLVRLRWLDVDLAGEWFRLWLEGAYHCYIGRPVSPGEHWEGSFSPDLDDRDIFLPAGSYRACFTIKTEQNETIYTTAAFTIPNT